MVVQASRAGQGGHFAAMARNKDMKREEKSLLRKLAADPQLLFSNPFESQCGALCYRRNPDNGTLEFLLVTSRDSGRWIIPKGWPMKGKTLHRAAEIEAREEAGVRGKARKKPLGYFTYLKTHDDGSSVPCTVEVHLLETLRQDAAFREKGQREVEWMSASEAARRITLPELKGLFALAERKLR